MRRVVYIVIGLGALLAAWLSFGHQFDDPAPPVPDNVPAILQPEPEAPEPAPPTAPEAPPAAAQPEQRSEAGTVAPEAPARAVRAIGPDLITAPPVDATRLERVEPRQPLGELALAPDPATMPPAETLLYRPVALSAGLIEAQGHRIRLDGIEALPEDATCESAGRSWPCGLHARGAFRAWLRGRAVSCTVRPVAIDETVVSACRLGAQDAAEWLAQQGWTRSATGAYADVLEEARAAGRGIYGAPPS